jgi:hypothetical protein
MQTRILNCQTLNHFAQIHWHKGYVLMTFGGKSNTTTLKNTAPVMVRTHPD